MIFMKCMLGDVSCGTLNNLACVVLIKDEVVLLPKKYAGSKTAMPT